MPALTAYPTAMRRPLTTSVVKGVVDGADLRPGEVRPPVRRCNPRRGVQSVARLTSGLFRCEVERIYPSAPCWRGLERAGEGRRGVVSVSGPELAFDLRRPVDSIGRLAAGAPARPRLGMA